MLLANGVTDSGSGEVTTTSVVEIDFPPETVADGLLLAGFAVAAALLVWLPRVAQAQGPLEPAGEEEPSGEATEAEQEAAPEPGQPQPEKRRPRAEDDPDDEGPEPPLVVPAPDQLSGHFQLSPMAGVVFPFSNFERNTPQREQIGDGFMLGADLAHAFKYSEEYSKPDTYTAFVAPRGRYVFGRSGSVRTGSGGLNIIGLDKKC